MNTKTARVACDALNYKPYPDDPDFARARLTMTAARGETVELPESEYQRLGDLGALEGVEASRSMVERGLAIGTAGDPDKLPILPDARPVA